MLYDSNFKILMISFFFLYYSETSTSYRIKDPGFVFYHNTAGDDSIPVTVSFECKYGFMMLNYVSNVEVQYEVEGESSKIVSEPNGKLFYFGAKNGKFTITPSGPHRINVKMFAMPSKCSYFKVTNSPKDSWIGTPPVNVMKCAAFVAPTKTDEWKLKYSSSPEKMGTLDLVSNKFSKNAEISIWYGSSILKYTGRSGLKTFKVGWEVTPPDDFEFNIIYSTTTPKDKEPHFLENSKWSTNDEGKNRWSTTNIILITVFGVLFIVIIIVVIFAVRAYQKKKAKKIAILQAAHAVSDLTATIPPPTDPNIPIVDIIQPSHM